MKDTVVVHHTAGNGWATPAQIAMMEITERGWPGFPYHYLIVPDGKAYRCQPVEAITYHCGNHNGHTIGVALGGDFTDTQPTAAQLQTAAKIINYLRMTMPWIVAVVGHRDLEVIPPDKGTQCPGNTWITGTWQSKLRALLI